MKVLIKNKILLCAILLPLSQPAFAQGVKIGEVGGWDIKLAASIDDIEDFFKELGGLLSDFGELLAEGWGAVFSRHPTIQQIYNVNGKFIVAVPVSRDAGGTRLTYNINFDPAWLRDTWVHVVVANVPPGSDPATMTFQQKYDEDWDEDPDIGPIMRHGDFVRLSPGHGRYMASRSQTKYWNSIILFVEDGLLPSDLEDLSSAFSVPENKKGLVFVDFSYGGLLRTGAESTPFNRLPDAFSLASPGGTIAIKASRSSELLTITYPCTITANGGVVTIGQ